MPARKSTSCADSFEFFDIEVCSKLVMEDNAQTRPGQSSRAPGRKSIGGVNCVFCSTTSNVHYLRPYNIECPQLMINALFSKRDVNSGYERDLARFLGGED